MELLQVQASRDQACQGLTGQAGLLSLRAAASFHYCSLLAALPLALNLRALCMKAQLGCSHAGGKEEGCCFFQRPERAVSMVTQRQQFPAKEGPGRQQHGGR